MAKCYPGTNDKKSEAKNKTYILLANTRLCIAHTKV